MARRQTQVRRHAALRICRITFELLEQRHVLSSHGLVATDDRYELAVGRESAILEATIDVHEEVQNAASWIPSSSSVTSHAVIDGQWAALALPEYAEWSGIVVVFRHTNGQWNRFATIVDPIGQQDSLFGSSVALQGNRLVIGSDPGTPSAEQWTYVFEFNGATWSETARLPTAAAEVDLDNDHLVVSDYRRGIVRFFQLSETEWESTGSFTLKSPAVSIENGRAVVGLRNASSFARLFEFDTTWRAVQELPPQASNPSAIDLDGDRMVIGSSVFAENWIFNQSAIYVYELSTDGTWLQTAALRSDDPIGRTTFGDEVSLVGDTIVAQIGSAGAAADQNHLFVGPWGSRPPAGAYVFREHEGVWETRQLLAAEPAGAFYSMPTADQSGLAISASTGLLTNDDVTHEGDVHAVMVNRPNSGSASVELDGSFTYVPTNGFRGVDEFLYRLEAADAQSVPATVRIEATEFDDAPVAVADTYSMAGLQELRVAADNGVLVNDRDPEGKQLVPTVTFGPGHGRIVLGRDGSFVYIADPGYSGPDYFYYRVNDGQHSSLGARVWISERGIPSLKTTVDDAYFTFPGQPLTTDGRSGVAANDIYRPADTTLSVLRHPAHGTLSFNVDGSFQYVPVPGFVGQDSFVYEVDNANHLDAATVELTVRLQFVARDDFFTASQSASLEVSSLSGLLANDSFAVDQFPQIAVVSSPRHGSLDVGLGGGFTYVPDVGYQGRDEFVYRLVSSNDTSRSSAPVAVIIDVVEPLQAVDDDYRVHRDGTLDILTDSGVLANDRTTNRAVQVINQSDPPDGRLSVAGDGSLIYKPDPGFVGTDAFNYEFRQNPEPMGILSPDGSPFRSWDSKVNDVGVEGDVLAVVTERRLIIFQRDGNDWVLKTTFQSGDVVSWGDFSRLKVTEGLIALSDWQSSEREPGVHLFTRVGSGWDWETTIRPEPDHASSFGFSIAVSESTIAIAGKTSAFVYERVSSGWQITGQFEGSYSTVRLDRQTLAIGHRGYIEIYEKSAGQWLRTFTIWPPLSMERDFDFTVGSIEGDTLVATTHFGGDYNGGSIFVYRRKSATWDFEAELQPSKRFSGQSFGAFVEIESDVIAATSSGGFTGKPLGSVFRQVGSHWQEDYLYEVATNDVARWLQISLSARVIVETTVGSLSSSDPVLRVYTLPESLDSAGVSIDVKPASVWTNLGNPYDIDGDGFIAPLDVLQIINELNRTGARELPDRDNTMHGQFYDVNGDGRIEPLDVLIVINRINQESSARMVKLEPSAMLSAGAGVGVGAPSDHLVSKAHAGSSALRSQQSEFATRSTRPPQPSPQALDAALADTMFWFTKRRFRTSVAYRRLT